MTIQVKIEEHARHMAAKFKGVGDAQDFERLYTAMVGRCQRAHVHKCLSDVTDTEISFSTQAHYLLAQSVKVVGHTKIKLAVLVLAMQVDPEKLAEKAARKAGIQMRVFVGKDAALAWLLAD